MIGDQLIHITTSSLMRPTMGIQLLENACESQKEPDTRFPTSAVACVLGLPRGRRAMRNDPRKLAPQLSGCRRYAEHVLADGRRGANDTDRRTEGHNRMG